MQRGILKLSGTEIKYSFLKDSNNNWMQFLYTIIPDQPEQTEDQIKTIEQAESELYKTFEIKNDTDWLGCK